jgi:hypothetical protein
MNVRAGILLVAWALLSGAPQARSADADRHVTVWIIPPEESGPNDIARGEDIPTRMEALRLSLAGTRVRLLNVEDPLATKAGSHRSGNSGEAGWYPDYAGPNFEVVVNQRKTFSALARFAEQNNIYVVLRLITWREAFELLRSARTAGPDALPDLMEVGTTWTGNLAANGRIRSRPDWQTNRGNWRDVLGMPACALPYTTDVRLLFYWKRLPSAAPDSPPLTLNQSSWPALLDSRGRGTSSAAQSPYQLLSPLIFSTTMCRWSGLAEAPRLFIMACSAPVCLSLVNTLLPSRSISPSTPRSLWVRVKFAS